MSRVKNNSSKNNRYSFDSILNHGALLLLFLVTHWVNTIQKHLYLNVWDAFVKYLYLYFDVSKMNHYLYLNTFQQ